VLELIQQNKVLKRWLFTNVNGHSIQ
jgi:hypothetical protein